MEGKSNRVGETVAVWEEMNQSFEAPGSDHMNN